MRNVVGAALVAILVLAMSGAVAADQIKIKNYESARDTYFYKKLYPSGGWTLYCGARFKGRSGLNVEHVYPASWMKETAGCGALTRPGCRRESTRFNHMEADLHNLYPTVAQINQARSNYTFKMVRGEVRDYSVPKDMRRPQGEQLSCDFELNKDQRIAEPRPIARGNIARAIFYMHDEYDLPVDRQLGVLLQKWNEADPPSAHEKRRNAKIEDLQGTRNRFIDNPSLANGLRFTSNSAGMPPVVERILAGLARSDDQIAQQRCCKICQKGKACGNSCISRDHTCRQPPGCACNG